MGRLMACKISQKIDFNFISRYNQIVGETMLGNRMMIAITPKGSVPLVIAHRQRR